MKGFETSSTTMTMALYELAYRHEIQDKLRKEIDEVIKSHDDKITYQALNEMPYLDQVINGNLITLPFSLLFNHNSSFCYD